MTTTQLRVRGKHVHRDAEAKYLLRVKDMPTASALPQNRASGMPRWQLCQQTTSLRVCMKDQCLISADTIAKLLLLAALDPYEPEPSIGGISVWKAALDIKFWIWSDYFHPRDECLVRLPLGLTFSTISAHSGRPREFIRSRIYSEELMLMDAHPGVARAL